jgi:hypothetical protein
MYVSGLKIQISITEFHRIHNMAQSAVRKIRAVKINMLKGDYLQELIEVLRDGQRLADAEVAAGLTPTASYSAEIVLIETELAHRGKP